ncbi:DUF4123 domain-containing protein [Pseudomonas sp. L-22-4S-12]|uniref:DUF4123 domain-containing protein n=1 Tax=Pseudomonas sp. L-22-4S-12 TaxID=2610893 RepID=UPI00132149E3|nr:DUF4123 domain-containing protein [Pseudomonas sp. L-22-4S-12]MWV14739.1 DUF4123 domain-containing protein [Pseudomonas sp. L-22-4S-12]
MTNQLLLIDGVLRQDATKWIYQSGEPLEVIPLYLGTRWEELQELGPILVALDAWSPLLGAIQHDNALQSQASLISTQAPSTTVAEHLSQFISITDDLGSQSLLRFADPLVTWHWLASYPEQAYKSLLGPISQWNVAVRPPNWAPSTPWEWRAFRPQPDSPTLAHPLSHMTQSQVEALDQAHRWRFKERLYDWLDHDFPNTLRPLAEDARGRWLEQRIQDAETWGLVSERSIAIWLERCAYWGSDFATRPDSPYQEWLRRKPVAQQLPPELRIQALDDDCLTS